MSDENSRTCSHRTKSSLTALFYDLLGNHIPAGVLDRIVTAIERVRSEDPSGSFILTSGHLARYAEDLAHRIDNNDNTESLQPPVPRGVIQQVAADEIVVPIRFLERFMADWAVRAHPTMSVADMKKFVRKVCSETGASHLKKMFFEQVAAGIPDIWRERWEKA